MSKVFGTLVLELLYGMEELAGEGADGDQILHWMVAMTDAIGALEPAERTEFLDLVSRLAADAEAQGDSDRADAYRRIAEAEGDAG